MTYTDFQLFRDAMSLEGVTVPARYGHIIDRYRRALGRRDQTGDEIFVRLWKTECWDAGFNPADVVEIAKAMVRFLRGTWTKADVEIVRFVVE